MSTRRIFTGGRDTTKNHAMSITAQIRKIEFRKRGKMLITPAERYKLIVKAKMAEHQNKSVMSSYSTFMLKGSATTTKKMSRKAEQALKEMATKKAAKEAKALRQRVVIQPRSYGGLGHINVKGVVYDHVGNITMKVDAKTGKIKTMGGWGLGKYKPKSFFHVGMMQGWIKKYSPYHMQLQKIELMRRMQLLQQQQQQSNVSVHGVPLDPALLAQYMLLQQQVDSLGNVQHHVDAHGNTPGGEGLSSIGRTNADITSWGVRSGNVWGTFGENVYGGFQDNAWGTTNNNIWGGMGDSGNLWGQPGRRMFSSSRGGKNYIAMWGRALKAMMFGGGQRNARYARGSSNVRMASAPVMRTGPGSGGGARPGAAPRGGRR